jgi:hypothetical protein
MTGVEVIGGAPDDLALCVKLEGSDDHDQWFEPDLVELVDHDPGMEVVVGGRRFVREADGEWIEDPPPTRAPTSAPASGWRRLLRRR